MDLKVVDHSHPVALIERYVFTYFGLCRISLDLRCFKMTARSTRLKL